LQLPGFLGIPKRKEQMITLGIAPEAAAEGWGGPAAGLLFSSIFLPARLPILQKKVAYFNPFRICAKFLLFQYLIYLCSINNLNPYYLAKFLVNIFNKDSLILQHNALCKIICNP
jgi:hypothetical protein